MLIPIIEKFSERIQRLIMWFDNLRNSQKQMIVKIAGLLAVIGPLSIVLGFLVGNILPGLIKVGWIAVKMFKALSMAILMNPVAALGVLIGYFVIKAIIPLIKKTKEATTAQLAWNKSVKEGKELMDISQSIAKRMELLHTLNERQIEELKSRIVAQTKMEEDFTTDLLTELKRRLKGDEQLAEMRSKVAGIEDEMSRMMMQKMIQGRKEFIAEDLELERRRSIERIKILKDYLKQAEMALVGLGPKDEKGKGFVSPEVVAAMKTLRTELEFINLMTALQGDAFETTSARAQAYNQALQLLAREGLGAMDPNIQKVLRGLEEVKQVMEDDIAMALIFAEATRGIDEAWELANKTMEEDTLFRLRELQGLMGDIAEEAGFFASFIGSAFQGMSNVIADSLNSTEGFLKSFASFFKDFIKGMVFRLIAATIAALALAVVLSMIFPGGTGGAKIFKNLDKVTTFGKTFKAGLQAFSGVGLAEGGIVTRPTLALIGERGPEAVVPLDRMANQPVVINLIGEWVNKGEDMEYIVREQIRKQRNSF
ncbi:MAG TPA: phage tail tape measure protein [bacterium]|nr:phage tail tape measure protein [bacterium]